jgi:outer membrane protein OmpA-like peptidoglycan-associated protein/opacity protein-like surface antigen
MEFRHLLLGTACVLGSIGAAEAAITTPTGWYLSLGAGVNWIEDGDVTEFDPPGVLETVMHFSWEDGFVATGAVGYDFGDHWRAEFEVAYRDNDDDGFCRGGRSCAGGSTDVWEFSQMVNVLYDIGLGGNWEASVGAGVGGNLVAMRSGSFFDTSGTADDYVLAGQLIAQVGYRFAERWQLYLDYHYMIMDDPEFQNPGDALDVFEMEKTDHSLLIGIRFDLQRDGAAPMAPRPSEPTRAPKQFIVFFGFNKSNLTPEAARVVADAAAAAKEYGSASIMVVGHTDSSGSSSYNQALSMRRSQAVKDGLANNGVPGSMVSTSGRGEAELMVQTGDGVKEPQNRRATIDLN